MVHMVIFPPPAAPPSLHQISTAEPRESHPATREAKALLTAGATLPSGGEAAHEHAAALAASSCFSFVFLFWLGHNSTPKLG